MAQKRVCLLGEVNSGKSSLGNVLLGLDLATSYGFHTSEKDASLLSIIRHSIEHPDVRVGGFLGDKSKSLKLVLAPKAGQDHHVPVQQRVVDCIKGENEFDAFVWVKNANTPKVTCEESAIFQIFLEKFGGLFLNNLVVVLTNWSFSSEADRRRKLTRCELDKVKKSLWNSLVGRSSHADKFPIVTIDAIHNKNCPKEAGAFKTNTEELWNTISQMSPVIDVVALKEKAKK